MSLKSLRAGLTLVIETICIFLLVVLTGAVVYSSTMRYLGWSPTWYDEVAQILLAWLTYFAAVYAALKRDHMGFSGFVLAMPEKLRAIVFLSAEALVIGFFAIVAWYGWKVLPFVAYDTMVSLRWVSLDFVQSIIPISAVLMIIAFLITLPDAFADAMARIDHEHATIEGAIAEADADLETTTVTPAGRADK